MAQLVNISKTLRLKENATVNEFSTWTIRYKALAMKEKFDKVMLGTETRPMVGDPYNMTPQETVAIKEFKKKNEDGFSHLLLSVTKEKDIQAIANSTTPEFPTGCIATAWDKLNHNYKPKTGQLKNELIQVFYSTYLDKMSYPPEPWFAGMNRIKKDLENLHSFTISNEDLVSHILANTCHEYDSTLTEHQIGSKANPPNVNVECMIDDLQEQFELYW